MSVCTACPLCDEPGTIDGAVEVGRVPCNVRRFHEEAFTVWRCTGCASLHCVEDADLPRYYRDYPLQKQRLGFHERIGYGNRLKLLEKQGFTRSQRLLDYGCGAGLFVEFLREAGVSQAFGYDAFVSSYNDPDMLRQTYDAVVSYDVIEHDDDTRGYLKRLVDLVTPGGLLIVGTPRAEGLSVARKTDPQLHMPYHRHIVSERVLLALGREQGLKPAHLYRRSFYDSFYPTVNWRFLTGMVQESGGLLDAAVEPPRKDLLWRSPQLLWWAIFGYFFPAGDTMIVTFRRPSSYSQEAPVDELVSKVSHSEVLLPRPRSKAAAQTGAH